LGGVGLTELIFFTILKDNDSWRRISPQIIWLCAPKCWNYRLCLHWSSFVKILVILLKKRELLKRFSHKSCSTSSPTLSTKRANIKKLQINHYNAQHI